MAREVFLQIIMKQKIKIQSEEKWNNIGDGDCLKPCYHYSYQYDLFIVLTKPLFSGCKSSHVHQFSLYEQKIWLNIQFVFLIKEKYVSEQTDKYKQGKDF